ncbi:MAG: HD domain-containing protein [Deltaproteobacteria bacterium]
MSRKIYFDIQQYCRRIEKLIGTQEGEARTFWRALSFAVDAHSGQLRKSGEAYVSHPIQVALILIEELGICDPDTLAAAVLHDTVEDVPEVTGEEIGGLFGRKIETIVDGCTKISSFIGDRKSFYQQVHRKIFSGAASEVAVILIKLADRLHNLRTMESMPRNKRQKIADETLAVYAPLAKVMGLFSMKRELYNLALTYKFPRQSQKVLTEIRQRGDNEETRSISDTLVQEMEKVWLSCTIEVRPRGLSAYFDQKRKTLTKVPSLPVQIIIVVDDIQSCYRALGVVNQLYPPLPRTIRDFIANPKPTGYQSLHAKANIRGNNYLFKIRTRDMQIAARNGVIREWLQKGKMPTGFEQEIREMFDILGTEDSLSYQEVIAASEKKEIYTYTPKGDRICLPRGSLVLDFAFKVHTEVGSHCIGAMVGETKVNPEYALRDGDRVRILLSEKPVRFDPRIQQLCQSPKARSEIARLLRMRVENLANQAGTAILEQELRRCGIPLSVLDQPEFEHILSFFRLSSKGEMFRQIGTGKLRLAELVYEIRNGLWPSEKLDSKPATTRNRLELSSLDPVCIKLSRCCNPVPVDKGLIGLLSERGLSVHRQDCERFLSLKLRREDIVDLSWNRKKTMVEKVQTMIVLKAARHRILMMLGTAPEEMRLLEVISLSRYSSRLADWEIHFRVETLQGLKNTLNHFQKAGMHFEFGLEQ